MVIATFSVKWIIPKAFRSNTSCTALWTQQSRFRLCSFPPTHTHTAPLETEREIPLPSYRYTISSCVWSPDFLQSWKWVCWFSIVLGVPMWDSWSCRGVFGGVGDRRRQLGHCRGWNTVRWQSQTFGTDVVNQTPLISIFFFKQWS